MNKIEGYFLVLALFLDLVILVFYNKVALLVYATVIGYIIAFFVKQVKLELKRKKQKK